MLPKYYLLESHRIEFQVFCLGVMMDKLKFYADIGMDASNLKDANAHVEMKQRINIVTANFTNALNRFTKEIQAMSENIERQSLELKKHADD